MYVQVGQVHPKARPSSSVGCCPVSKLFTNASSWGGLWWLDTSPWLPDCWVSKLRTWLIVSPGWNIAGIVAGPLRISRFSNEVGGLACKIGNGSVPLAVSVERSPWTDRDRVLVARLIWGEAAAVVAAALLAALTGKLVDAEFPRPRRSASDLRNPAVLPDKRYKNTVCPDCLTFKSFKVSCGLGNFLPTIHFCTWTGKPYLSNT